MYTYDSIGRMTQATVDSNTKNYTYDKVGNRLTMSDGTDTYTYHYDTTGFNQLGSITLNDQTVYASYTYDGRGNQTQEQIQKSFNGTTKTQTTDYTYDLLNTLTAVSVTAPGETSQSETNEYNASGQRVKRLENGETTKYYYSGSATLFTTNANNYLLTENILDLSGNIIASARFDDQNPNNTDYSGQYFFYHYDMRGSTTAIVYPDGNLVKGYSYDTFGQLTQSGDGVDFLNDVTFTGSVTDTSTGLQYMNARYYNPSTGRFLSQDTYSGNPYDPWTQHLYSYCNGNPVNFVDPTGYSVSGVKKPDIPGIPKINPEVADRFLDKLKNAKKQSNDTDNKGDSFFKKAGKTISDFAKSTFGSGATLVYEKESQVVEHVPSVLNTLVTVETGTRTDITAYNKGDSSKPISVYAQGANGWPVSSFVCWI